MEVTASTAAHRFGRNPLHDAIWLLRQGQGEVTSPVIFDVGANIGQTVAAIKQELPRSTVHSFEPSPSTFRKLSVNTAQFEGVVLNNAGLGSEVGVMTLNQNSKSTMSSLLDFGPASWGARSNQFSVNIDTLDHYVEEKKIAKIDYLKIDTQGFDLEVLKGGKSLLKSGRIRLVLTEIIFSKMYIGLPKITEVFDLMASCNFSLVSFYAQYYRDNRVGWTDALFASDVPIEDLA